MIFQIMRKKWECGDIEFRTNAFQGTTILPIFQGSIFQLSGVFQQNHSYNVFDTVSIINLFKIINE